MLKYPGYSTIREKERLCGSNIAAVVLSQGLALTVIGIFVGVGAALLATRALAQLLFGISPLDAMSFSSSVVLLGLISLAACVVPALRSAFLDPVRTLKSE
jgi:ABC-type antimicrobial peptide transport system permease subunit